MANIYLISGPKRSQKTTNLTTWAQGRKDISGLLSPIMFGKRYFHNIRTGDLLPMEAELMETAVQQVGRYTFSESAFEWANSTLLEAVKEPDLVWLVIDEIGPLELQGKGLDPALTQILNNLPPHLHLVLVVRETIVESAIQLYELQKHPLVIIPSADKILTMLK